MRQSFLGLATGLLLFGQPAPEQVPLPTIARLSAPSENVVWTLVAGHLLFRSVDQGATWEQRDLPPGDPRDVSSISFVDDQEGWVARAGSPATQCQAQTVAIWHTTDSGGTWQIVDGDGIDQSGCKGEVSFIDSLHGFLDVWGQNIQPSMYSTSDGGATWSASQPLPDPPGVTTGPGGFELRPIGQIESFDSTLLVAVW